MNEEATRRYVRKSIINAIIFLGVIIGLSAILAIYFQEPIQAMSEKVVTRLGPLGFCVIAYLTDIIMSPVPPDIFLAILANAADPTSHIMLVTAMGVCSSLGGLTAWYLGYHWIHPRWFGPRVEKFVKENHALINVYGRWAVGIAALTPVPFSLTAWTAGFFEMDFKDFFLMSLLRIPRFLVYFGLLAYFS